MGHDAVMAAIARQNQQQTAPQAEPPKPESSPMQSLRQIFSGTVFDPRSRQDKREREAGLADGGFVRAARGFLGLKDRKKQIDEAVAGAAGEPPAPAPAEPRAKSGRPPDTSKFDPALVTETNPAGIRFADGGRVRPRGFVAGPGTGTSDSIKARLSHGEYVLPADTVQAVGVDALDALKDATHTPVAKPDKNRAGEPLFANAGLVDDERKRNSFGDAAAAANDYGVQQVMGKATQMTATPEVRAAIGQQLDAPERTQAAVNQIPTGISGSRPQASTPAAQTTLPVAAPVADPQVQADRAAIGSAWNSVKGMNENAGRAIANMATLVPRALVGAYDSAVVRPMRAAGLNAAYLSPALVPDGVDPSSMTPFTDQKRLREANTTAAIAPTQTDQRIASGAQPVPGAPAASPINTTDRSGDANMPAMDTGARGLALPAANDQSKPQQVAPSIYRQGNSFGDSPEAASWGARGSKNPNANDLAAADALANRSAQEVSAMAARLQQPTAAGFQPMQAPQVEHSGNSWQARNDLRNAQVSASSMTEQPGYGGIVTRRGVVGGQQGVGTASKQYAAMLAQDMKARGLEPELAGKAMQENAGLQREGMREQGQNARTAAELGVRGFDAMQRNAIERGRLGLDARRTTLDENVKNIDIRAGQRLEALQNRYASAKNDTERAAIAKEIRDLSGKDAGSDWAVQVTPATKNPDGSTSEASIYRYNKRTGDVQRVDGQEKQQKFEDGKVYTDANGNRRKWDEKNKQWQPV